MDAREKVAEAMCRFDTRREPDEDITEIMDNDGDFYRAQADAAIAALELAGEVGYMLPGSKYDPNDGRPDAWFRDEDIDADPEIAAIVGGKQRLFRRLVTPWEERS